MLKSTISLVVAMGLALIIGSAYAGQPTTADFDACNREALTSLKEGTKDPAASPRTQGLPSPTAPPSGGTPSTSGSAPSSDPQLQGITVGASPEYQVAYRECMKRRGF